MACAGGFTTSKMNLDLEGVDWQIAYPGPRGTTRSPKIEVQVKTATEIDIRDGKIRHRMRSRTSTTWPAQGSRYPAS